MRARPSLTTNTGLLFVILSIAPACSSSTGQSPRGTTGLSAGVVADGGSDAGSADGGATRGCALPDHPTPACTGVLPGTTLTELPLNRNGAYRVLEDGEVIDSRHIAGDLLITANHVVVKNSQIDGTVLNQYGPNHYSFSISDSTVGPATGCITQPGVGESMYTAERIYIRGHDDGFRMSGSDIVIRDSYFHQCSTPTSHADGIQSYCPTGLCSRLLFDHNTIDGRDAMSNTSIFLVDNNVGDITVTNNLVMAGGYTITVFWHQGTWTIQGNRVVDKTWTYGPERDHGTCSHIDWADNALVLIDASYRITSIVKALPCLDIK